MVPEKGKINVNNIITDCQISCQYIGSASGHTVVDVYVQVWNLMSRSTNKRH